MRAKPASTLAQAIKGSPARAPERATVLTSGKRTVSVRLADGTILRQVPIAGSASAGDEVWLRFDRSKPVAMASGAGSGGGSGIAVLGTVNAVSIQLGAHSISDLTVHTGTLADAQAPQFVKLDGSRVVTGYLPFEAVHSEILFTNPSTLVASWIDVQDHRTEIASNRLDLSPVRAPVVNAYAVYGDLVRGIGVQADDSLRVYTGSHWGEFTQDADALWIDTDVSTIALKAGKTLSFNSSDWARYLSINVGTHPAFTSSDSFFRFAYGGNTADVVVDSNGWRIDAANVTTRTTGFFYVANSAGSHYLKVDPQATYIAISTDTNKIRLQSLDSNWKLDIQPTSDGVIIENTSASSKYIALKGTRAYITAVNGTDYLFIEPQASVTVFTNDSDKYRFTTSSGTYYIDFLPTSEGGSIIAPTGNKRLTLQADRTYFYDYGQSYFAYVEPGSAAISNVASTSTWRWKDSTLTYYIDLIPGSEGATIRAPTGNKRLTLRADRTYWYDDGANYYAYIEPNSGGAELHLQNNTTGSLWLNGLILNVGPSSGTPEIRVNNTKVVSVRKTGWTAWTGTPTRSSVATGSATLANVAEALKALIDDLIGHGMIGA